MDARRTILEWRGSLLESADCFVNDNHLQDGLLSRTPAPRSGIANESSSPGRRGITRCESRGGGRIARECPQMVPRSWLRLARQRVNQSMAARPRPALSSSVEIMVHPTGVQEPNKNNGKPRLTGTLSLTHFRRDKNLMANLSGAPPSRKRNAPDLAATGSSAGHTNRDGMQPQFTFKGGAAQ